MSLAFACRLPVVLCLAVLSACAGPRRNLTQLAEPEGPAPDYAALVAAADRTEADRKLDEERRPVELLAFVGVRTGWRVAELGAGSGYTTELLARAVGPTGRVYAQNPAIVVDKYVKDLWPERLARPINAAVVRVDQEFDTPLPEEARKLDAVVMNLFYHDLYWFGTDRKAMNEAIFSALKPGGVFVIIDHSAARGAGTTEVKRLHRVEEAVVIEDVKAAGFTLVDEGQFLRNPDDARDWMVFTEGKRGHTDRFVLKFARPLVR
ncbi:MAG: methyltransferase domain-containing protein [Myxococcales bacterium]|nr:methyltransferase domain-containing protein [Myxococcales bacterium]